jgi:hypothetical protein
MKCRTFFAIAGICFFAIGCKSKIAMDYNDMIVQRQKSLGTDMEATEPGLKNYFASFEYDSIVNVSNRMETKIDSILQEIKKKPAPKVKEGANFKKAALRYFDYMKSIYTSYKNYGLQSTPEGRQIELQVMSMVINQEDKMIADMQEAQRIFAKDNNFKIKTTKQNSSLVAK